jgi:hypothetical protein
MFRDGPVQMPFGAPNRVRQIVKFFRSTKFRTLTYHCTIERAFDMARLALGALGFGFMVNWDAQGLTLHIIHLLGPRG